MTISQLHVQSPLLVLKSRSYMMSTSMNLVFLAQGRLAGGWAAMTLLHPTWSEYTTAYR